MDSSADESLDAFKEFGGVSTAVIYSAGLRIIIFGYILHLLA